MGLMAPMRVAVGGCADAHCLLGESASPLTGEAPRRRGRSAIREGHRSASTTSIAPDPPAGREGLCARLDAVADAGGVALIAAEPGTGKTVLLRQWLASRAEPVAPCAPGAAAARLRAGDAPLVVVDGAEALDDDARVDLGDALARRPAGVAAVVAARADLGLGASELGRTGPLLLLDGDDLALSDGEVGDALEAGGWGAVSPAEARAVAHETDGWCAAVRLAAAAGRAERRGGFALDVVRDVAGDATVEQLMALSALDDLDAAGVAATLGLSAEDAALRLRALVAARVFLRRGPREGTWRLARPVLRALRQELAARPAIDGAAVPGMGAALLEDAVLAPRALELLLAGRLVAPAPQALAATAPPSRAGRAAAALALMDAGDAETARALIEPEDALGDGVDEGVALALAVAGARAAGDRAAATAALERIAERARRQADPQADGLEAYALLQLGRLDLAEGRIADADERLSHAAGLAERCGASAVFARARIARASLAVGAGRFHEAERLARSVGDDQPRAETRARRALVLAEVAYQRDDRASARAQATAARAAAEDSRSPEIWFGVLFLDALLLDGEGDDDRAFERLAEAVAAREACPSPPSHGRTLELLRGRLLARAGRVDEADALLARLEAEGDGFADPLVDLALARHALTRGVPDEASRLLHRWAVESPVTGLEVWHLAAYALAADRLGDADAAHAALERALDRAAPEGAMRPFLEDGVRLRELLERHLARGTAHAAFLGGLVQHIPSGRPVPEGELLRPLTVRERTVLGHLPTELSAGQIAEALHVSEATVRTHMHNVYEKLGVPSRRDAVARARELRLLTVQQL
jgi:LuxR family transcriptional regulator, maltose regulon positive regulatory protein